jgi:hypothetical protein
LPRPIRDALQDGVSPLCPLKVRKAWREARRQHGDAAAITHVLRLIDAAQAWAADQAGTASEELRARVLPEEICPPDVAAQRVDAPMPAHFDHLQDRGARPCRTSQEAGAPPLGESRGHSAS